MASRNKVEEQQISLEAEEQPVAAVFIEISLPIKVMFETVKDFETKIKKKLVFKTILTRPESGVKGLILMLAVDLRNNSGLSDEKSEEKR